MVAITGPHLTRRHENLALAMTALAAMAAVIVPTFYVVLLPLACGVMALVAPDGRRVASALAVWLPVSAAVVLGFILA